MDKFIRKIQKLLHLRPRKIHLDYIAGILSIPLLITALILNIGNLKKTNAPSPTPTPQVIVIPQKSPPPLASPAPACTKSVGPIAITYPTEGATITDNPVCITIDYSDSNYCSVVWSYRINKGSWSDYNNNAPCLYNVPNGNVEFDLKVQSTASNDTKNITRNFVYEGANNPTVTPQSTSTPTPVASSSAH